MLIVDAHALEPVNLLHFIDEILSQGLFAKNVKNVVGIGRTVHQRLAGANAVAVMDADMLAFRNQILARLANFRRDHDFAFPLGVLTERDRTVDLTDHRELFRLARFEEFCHPRQTTGDVFGLGGFARDLRQDSPANTSWPSCTLICAPTGIK